MAAGTVSIGRTAIDGWPTVAIAVAVFAGMLLASARVNPAILVLGGGVVGMLAGLK